MCAVKGVKRNIRALASARQQASESPSLRLPQWTKSGAQVGVRSLLPCATCRRQTGVTRDFCRSSKAVFVSGACSASSCLSRTPPRARVRRLVKAELPRSWERKPGRPPPALLGDRGDELDALCLQLRPRAVEVLAHQVELMAASTLTRVEGQLRRRQPEDQPATASINGPKAEHLLREGTRRLGIVSKDDHVGTADHRR